MTDDRKPCPVCKSDETFINVLEHGYRVVCIDCGFAGPSNRYPGDAVDLWNTRTETPVKDSDDS